MKALTKKQSEIFRKSLPQRHVDPTVRVEAIIRTINRCFVASGLKVRVGGDQQDTARAAILELLRVTAALNELKIWTGTSEAWVMPDGFCWEVIPEHLADVRAKKIAKMVKIFEDGSADKKHLVRAMDVIDEAAMSMSMELSFALIPEGGFPKPYIAAQTYKCIATLAPICDLLTRFWYPIRNQLRKRHAKS